MNQTLQWILAQVNDWLKFAEAKNGALLVAQIALTVGLWELAPKPEFLGIYTPIYFTFLEGLLAIGAIVSALSFLPATQIPRLKPRGSPSPTDNLLFFGDIAKHTGDYYLQALQRREVIPSELGPLDRDLAVQIVINSRIAAWKYGCFKRALWLGLAAFITAPVAIVLFGALHLMRKHGAH